MLLLDKIILQMKAQEFYRNIIWNSTPTLKTYVDDMHSSFLKIGTSSSNPNLQFKSAISKNTFKVPRTKQLLAIQSPPNCPMLHVPTIIDEDKRVTIDEIFQELVNDFPRSIIYIYIYISLIINQRLFLVVRHWAFLQKKSPRSDKLTCSPT